MDNTADSEIKRLEEIAALTARVKEQEISIRVLLEAVAVALNPQNPEHALAYLRKAQQAAVSDSQELRDSRVIAALIEQARKLASS